jgi:farnesyl-diphosphate farnesyltransferase
MPTNGHGAMEEGQVWSGDGKTQDDLMLKDECILVNYMDEVIGHNNKYNCHKFAPGQPRGLLHRAFSVLLFDADNRLLLQQRASSKITFPEIWTNTCCSHPLYGMKPCEVDKPEEIAAGDPKGVKAAAVRKLGHELGIPAAELDASRFKFLTRVHYWAADVGTYGPDAIWGEHEIDHILLYRLNRGEKLTLKPNPEEVKATRWQDQTELKDAMAGKRDMPLWSPWFRIIAERFLHSWWQDLDAALKTNKHVDTVSIHRFDTAKEFHGGLGRAGPHLDAVAQAEKDAEKEGGQDKRRKVALAAQHADNVVGFVGRGKAEIGNGAGDQKQGGYGKVPTHKTPKLDQLMRPLEIMSGLRLKCTGLLENNIKELAMDADSKFCDDMLGRVSRSFAAVIRQLPCDLSMDICIFYLVLRALDTVEDDMEAYKGRESEKQAELISFGAKRLTDTNCSVRGVGEGDERTLIEQFGACVRVFNKLPEGSRTVIMDITNQMGAGMAEYVAADLGQGTLDKAAYDRYCHMVAGLVGEGLTRIFVSRGFENESLSGQGELVWPFCADPAKTPSTLGLANSMGLFLQKANIIRDYLEDYVDGRAFWPQSVWKKHAYINDLGEFAQPTAHGAGLLLPMKVGADIMAKGVGVQALMCLNELVADALELVPDALEYLERVKTPAIYRFCAIPQVMAIATLAECFNNPKVFTGVVKIRKGLTARLIVACCDGQDAVAHWFAQFAQDIAASVNSGKCVGAKGPIGEKLAKACSRILERTETRASAWGGKQTQTRFAVGALAALAVSSVVLRSRS